MSFNAGSSIALFGGGLTNAYQLAGTVDYGPAIQATVAPHFEPILGGAVGPGNQWLACAESLTGCAPPENPAKQLAGEAGLVAGVVALKPGPPPVTLALGVFGVAMGIISLDPPDRHFKKVAGPLRVLRHNVLPGRGLSRRAARALSIVENEFATAGAVGDAYITAWQRYQGAIDAKT